MEKEGSWTPDNERQFRQMLRSLNPDPIDAISIHAYGEDTERIAWSVRAAKSIKTANRSIKKVLRVRVKDAVSRMISGIRGTRCARVR